MYVQNPFSRTLLVTHFVRLFVELVLHQDVTASVTADMLGSQKLFSVSHWTLKIFAAVVVIFCLLIPE